jgi:hypothetical protein
MVAGAVGIKSFGFEVVKEVGGWDGVISVGEMKVVTQHFSLSSSNCGRAANNGAQRGSTVVPAAVAWMLGGGRRPGWVGLG